MLLIVAVMYCLENKDKKMSAWLQYRLKLETMFSTRDWSMNRSDPIDTEDSM